LRHVEWRLLDRLVDQSQATLAPPGAEKPQDIAVSPDGRTLASAWADRSIHVLDTETSLERAVLRGHGSRVGQLSSAADGRSLFAATDDGELFAWDLERSVLVRRLSGHAARIESLAVSGDGTHLASGAWDGTVRWWDVASGALVQSWPLGA